MTKAPIEVTPSPVQLSAGVAATRSPAPPPLMPTTPLAGRGIPFRPDASPFAPPARPAAPIVARSASQPVQRLTLGQSRRAGLGAPVGNDAAPATAPAVAQRERREPGSAARDIDGTGAKVNAGRRAHSPPQTVHPQTARPAPTPARPRRRWAPVQSPGRLRSVGSVAGLGTKPVHRSEDGPRRAARPGRPAGEPQPGRDCTSAGGATETPATTDSSTGPAAGPAASPSAPDAPLVGGLSTQTAAMPTVARLAAEEADAPPSPGQAPAQHEAAPDIYPQMPMALRHAPAEGEALHDARCHVARSFVEQHRRPGGAGNGAFGDGGAAGRSGHDSGQRRRARRCAAADRPDGPARCRRRSGRAPDSGTVNRAARTPPLEHSRLRLRRPRRASARALMPPFRPRLRRHRHMFSLPPRRLPSVAAEAGAASAVGRSVQRASAGPALSADLPLAPARAPSQASIEATAMAVAQRAIDAHAPEPAPAAPAPRPRRLSSAR